MKLCEICKKNIAMILTSKVENGKTETKALCIECARKKGIPVMDQLMQQASISPEDIENLNLQMSSIFKDMNLDELDFEGFKELIMQKVMGKNLLIIFSMGYFHMKRKKVAL